MFGILRQVQGWVKLKGDTDGTKIGNVGDQLKTSTSVVNIEYSNSTITMLGIVQSAGFLSGETYDQIIYGLDGSGNAQLEFNLSGVAQFNIIVEVVSQTSWKVTKVAPIGFLLQENGDVVLQETGDAILVQGLIPAS